MDALLGRLVDSTEQTNNLLVKMASNPHQTADLATLFSRLAAGGNAPRVHYVAGHWLDVNDAFDLARARDFL